MSPNRFRGEKPKPRIISDMSALGEHFIPTNQAETIPAKPSSADVIADAIKNNAARIEGSEQSSDTQDYGDKELDKIEKELVTALTSADQNVDTPAVASEVPVWIPNWLTNRAEELRQAAGNLDQSLAKQGKKLEQVNPDFRALQNEMKAIGRELIALGGTDKTTNLHRQTLMDRYEALKGRYLQTVDEVTKSVEQSVAKPAPAETLKVEKQVVTPEKTPTTPASNESQWFNKQNKELEGLKTYHKSLPKRIFEDQEVALVHEEFLKDLKALEAIIETTADLPLETETMKAVLAKRKGKISELNTSLQAQIKIFEDASYKIAGTTKATGKKETIAQKSQRELGEQLEERTEEIAQAVTPAEKTPQWDSAAYQEGLDIVAEGKSDTTIAPVRTEELVRESLKDVAPWARRMTTPAGITSTVSNRIRPAFVPPDVAPPAYSPDALAFVGPEVVALKEAGEKRAEIKTKREEWTLLRQELSAAEKNFRDQERAEMVAWGERNLLAKVGGAMMFKKQSDSPELSALRDRARELKVKYIQNIKENTVLRKEERDLRVSANVATPATEGAITPGQKDPERDLQHSFAKRFIVESAQQTLETKQQVTQEQRPEILQSAARLFNKIMPEDPATRQKLARGARWGGRAIGLLAVSGVAAFAAPAIAGTAALGAATTYGVRLVSGMAGGKLAARLAERMYGRGVVERAESTLGSAKTANVSVLGSESLSQDSFKRAESTYVAAQRNLQSAQFKRTLVKAGATIAGSFGAASATELGSAVFQSFTAPTPTVEGVRPLPQNDALGNVIPGEPTPEVAAAPAAAPTTPVRLNVRLPEETGPTINEQIARFNSGNTITPPPVEAVGQTPLTLNTDRIRESIASGTPRPTVEPLRPGSIRNDALGNPIDSGVAATPARAVAVERPVIAPAATEAIQTIAGPRAPEMVTIRPGNNLWRLTNERYATEFRGIPNAQRDRILGEIFSEIQASPEARRTLGLSSGRVGLIYPNENLNFADIHERLQSKLNNYRLRNNLPLPVPSTPAPVFVPTETTPVRLNMQLPEDMRAGGAELAARIEGLRVPAVAPVAEVVSGLPPRVEVPVTPPVPAAPPEVPRFVDPGLTGQPPTPEFGTVPGRLTGAMAVEGVGVEERVPIRVAEVTPVEAPARPELPAVTPAEANPRSGQFGRLVEQVFGSPRSFDAARTAMIESVVPPQSTSWWENLLGNNNNTENAIDIIGNMTLEDFEELDALPEGALVDALAEENISVEDFNAWREQINAMDEELRPQRGVTINQLINHHVLRNPDRYLPPTT